jgi:hypothetical protein
MYQRMFDFGGLTLGFEGTYKHKNITLVHSWPKANLVKISMITLVRCCCAAYPLQNAWNQVTKFQIRTENMGVSTRMQALSI